jgi:hypothetical protein
LQDRAEQAVRTNLSASGGLQLDNSSASIASLTPDGTMNGGGAAATPSSTSSAPLGGFSSNSSSWVRTTRGSEGAHTAGAAAGMTTPLGFGFSKSPQAGLQERVAAAAAAAAAERSDWATPQAARGRKAGSSSGMAAEGAGTPFFTPMPRGSRANGEDGN